MDNQGKSFVRWGVVALALFGATSAVAQAQQKTPYWASIEEPEARMRTGPSTEFPVTWVYKRRNLPVKVVAVHSVWRRVQDPDGEQGWLHVRLLSPKRTAIVVGKEVGALRDAPEPNAHISWRVEPGVVGVIDECDKGYCRFETEGRYGYIESARIWGDDTP